jgi:hypothetical protein
MTAGPECEIIRAARRLAIKPVMQLRPPPAATAVPPARRPITPTLPQIPHPNLGSFFVCIYPPPDGG